MKAGEQNLMTKNKSRPPKDINKKRNRLMPILLWSLLIHLLLLIIFLIFAFKKEKIFLITPKKPLAQQSEMPATLKPRQSAFGTTIVFDDEPQFKPAKAKLMAELDQKGKDLKELLEETPPPTPQIKAEEPKPEQKQKLKQEQEIKREPKQEEKPKEPIIQESKIQESKIPEPKPEQKEEVKPEPKQEDKIKDQQEIEKKIKEIEKKQKLTAQAPTQIPEPPELPKTQKLRTLGQSQYDKSPIISPRKSIVSMTKGFVENLKDKGDDWIKRKGDDNKRPSFEELKYISYEQQVNWHLQNSWKQHFAHSPRTFEGKAVVGFAIDEKGYVHNVNLLQSSGNNDLDSLIVKSVNYAAPFPPLPKHFETKSYETGRIIHVTSKNLRF